MTTNDIQAAIQATADRFHDPRIHLCRLELLSFENGRAALSGEVLDEITLEGAKKILAARVPGVEFDLSAVRVLRSGFNACLAVSTNLTSLHAAPSFLAEQVTQALNGVMLEELKEQGKWVFVRQADGYLAWTYRPYLSPQPVPPVTHWVVEPVSPLWNAPSAGSGLVSRILGGTGIAVRETRAGFGRLDLPGGLCGWLDLAHLRPVTDLPADEAGRRETIVADAFRYLGVPYLWGGCTANGIDCSGLAQLAHRLSGMRLPRDADMQFETGQPVEFPFQPGDLVFFGEGEDNQRITHVGISLGGWKLIHSSRARNGVYTDDIQAVPHLKDSFAGVRTFLR